MKDIAEIGKRVKNQREKGKFTQQDIAELLGVSVRTIANYENGDTDIPSTKLKLLSKQFNVSYIYLVDGISPKDRIEEPNNSEPEEMFSIKPNIVADTRESFPITIGELIELYKNEINRLKEELKKLNNEIRQFKKECGDKEGCLIKNIKIKNEVGV